MIIPLQFVYFNITDNNTICQVDLYKC